jgi:hypothetical protein
MIHFLKNVALIGALLLVSSIDPQAQPEEAVEPDGRPFPSSTMIHRPAPTVQASSERQT